jgi:hypothetical protein
MSVSDPCDAVRGSGVDEDVGRSLVEGIGMVTSDPKEDVGSKESVGSEGEMSA